MDISDTLKNDKNWQAYQRDLLDETFSHFQGQYVAYFAEEMVANAETEEKLSEIMETVHRGEKGYFRTQFGVEPEVVRIRGPRLARKLLQPE